MVEIKPFKAIRPPANLAKQVATLPYDVLNSQEARVLAEGNPYSYLHIDKAEIDLDATLSPYDSAVYQKAAANLHQFLENGWLIKEATDNFYLYELTMAGRSQTGLVACTAIADYENGLIKKHEYTRPEKEQDRINHSDACDANTSPIFLTYRQQSAIQAEIATWQANHEPVYDFDSFHDVHHRVWLIDDPQVTQTFVDYFQQEVPALYIADGHHRTESAVKVGKLRQALPGEHPEANYFLSVLFPKEELAIWDYNRLVNVALPENFFQQLEVHFTVTPVDTGKPQKPKTFGMYLEGQWYQLALKSEAHPQDPVASLDVSVLQQLVIDQIFGIEDVRTDQRIDFIGGIRGMAELERLVDQKVGTVAFALYPTTMDDLLAVADANKIMPPKSTWFEPKLLSGLFLHDLESKNKYNITNSKT